MAERSARGVATSVVGWLIVIVIAWLLLGSVLGTVRFLLRVGGIVVVIVVLLWIWFRLKAGSDDD